MTTNTWITRLAATSIGAGVVWALMSSPAVVRVDAAGSCEGLASLALPGAAITLAQGVTAGGFVQPGANPAQRGNAAAKLQPFCRVAVTLKPSSDSDIKMEIWMPTSNWNGKFQAVGNGAFNGSIAYDAMMTALSRGYATSSTDTGHTGGSASFGLGHPEKVTDFGWRAVHEMTVASKKIIAGYYESGPKFSYWNGCSAGGRQAMKAAQRFPADFDGIIAGAPGLDWTGRAASALRVAKPLEGNEPARLTQTARQLLHTATVEACDLADGVKDGLIENPKSCTFDPGVLECKGAARRQLLDESAGRNGAVDLRGSGEPGHKTGDHRPRARKRAGMERSGVDLLGAHNGTRTVPLPGVRRSELGRAEVQFRNRHRACRGTG